jgi:hypothetical protein
MFESENKQNKKQDETVISMLINSAIRMVGSLLDVLQHRTDSRDLQTVVIQDRGSAWVIKVDRGSFVVLRKVVKTMHDEPRYRGITSDIMEWELCAWYTHFPLFENQQSLATNGESLIPPDSVNHLLAR